MAPEGDGEVVFQHSQNRSLHSGKLSDGIQKFVVCCQIEPEVRIKFLVNFDVRGCSTGLEAQVATIYGHSYS